MTRTSNPVASARPKRVPIGSANRLDVKNKEPGYAYRIVNDVDGRIDRFLEAGYELVPADKAGQVGSSRVDNPSALGSASTISVGKGQQAVVMRIKEEWAKEDAAAKLARIDEVEKSMVNEQRRKADYGELT